MSIKVGDKFIIEIGTIAELPDGKKKYFIKPFESLVFDKTGLAQLEPIEKAWENELEKAKLFAYKDGFENGKLWAIEENAKNRQGYYDNGYNNALEDANHAMTVLENMTETEREEWFEDYASIGEVVRECTIQRIIKSTKEYEKKKKDEEEIKVGDEVVYLPNDTKFYVIAESPERYKGIYYAEHNKYLPIIICDFEKDGCKKTGKHIDELEQLLDKLRGEEE